MWTWWDTSQINNHQRDLEIRNDSHSFNDETCDRVNHKRRNQFLLSRDIFTCLGSDHRYQLYLVRSRYRQVLFTRSMIWHSYDLVTCLQAVSMWYHREGPEYISPSSGWINPTLDPWASTNTFIVPKSTFIVILLRSDVWCHQSTLPVLVIDMTSWSKEYRYFVCVWYSNVNLMTWSYCYTYFGCVFITSFF